MFICLTGITCPVILAADMNKVPKKLLNAIEHVESNHRAYAVGDRGKAVGSFQIHPVTIQDVNRIVKYQKYKLSDRYNRDKSRAICSVILWHYEKNKTPEAMARRWNGGTNWQSKPATKAYWQKVRKEMSK